MNHPLALARSIELLSDASDVELALCYDVSMEGEDREIYPLYLVVAEMQSRGLNFDHLEGLLAHQYSFD